MALFASGSDQSLNITIKAKDEATASINRVRLSVGDLTKGFALGTIAVDALKSGFRFLSGTITESIARHEKHMEVQNRLVHIFKQATDASDESIRSLLAQADALDKIGVVSEEAIMAAQGTLATFDLQADSVRKLIPAFLDMVVAERGVNATTDDMIGLANGLGKVLQGQTGALSKQGFIFNAYQEELLKTGTETQKVATLTEILSSTYGGLNESQRKSAGSMFALEQRVEDLKKGVGSGLVPALNNLFSAFEATTSGMGRNVDIGKAVFKSISVIGETAAAAAVGIHAMGASLVNLATYGAQAATRMTGVSTVLKLVGKDSNQFFTDWRDSLHEQVDTTSDFYFNLKDKNDAVLASWGDISVSATNLAKVGPAAYQATAEEAKKAADQIKKTQQAISDTQNTLAAYRKDLQGEATNIGEAFVEQEEKIKDIQADLKEEQAKPVEDQDAKRIAALKADLTKEYAAYTSNRYIETQLPDQVANARRRANATDFERSIEDISGRLAQREQTAKNAFTYILNFNELVAGDDGVRRVITSVISEINRGATLRQVAGQ